MDFHKYYCHSKSSSNYNGNCYSPMTRCSICGIYRYRILDCTLSEAVYQKEKESQSSQWDSWKLRATTIPLNNTPSPLTTYIDIPKLNIKEGPNRTHMWTAEEWVIWNVPFARYDSWDQRPERNNPLDYKIKKYLPRKDSPSSQWQLAPDHTTTQLLQKLAVRIKVITPFYPPLIL